MNKPNKSSCFLSTENKAIWYGNLKKYFNVTLNAGK